MSLNMYSLSGTWDGQGYPAGLVKDSGSDVETRGGRWGGQEGPRGELYPPCPQRPIQDLNPVERWPSRREKRGAPRWLGR